MPPRKAPSIPESSVVAESSVVQHELVNSTPPDYSIIVALGVSCVAFMFLVYDEINTNLSSTMKKVRSASDMYDLNAYIFLEKTALFLFLGYCGVIRRNVIVHYLKTNAVRIAMAAAAVFVGTFVLEVFTMAIHSSVHPSDLITRVAVSLQNFFADIGYIAGFLSSFYIFIHDHLGMIKDAFLQVTSSYVNIFTSVFGFNIGFISYANYYSNQYLVYFGGILLFLGAQMLFCRLCRARVHPFFTSLTFHSSLLSSVVIYLYVGQLFVVYNVAIGGLDPIVFIWLTMAGFLLTFYGGYFLLVDEKYNSVNKSLVN